MAEGKWTRQHQLSAPVLAPHHSRPPRRNRNVSSNSATRTSSTPEPSQARAAGLSRMEGIATTTKSPGVDIVSEVEERFRKHLAVEHQHRSTYTSEAKDFWVRWEKTAMLTTSPNVAEAHVADLKQAEMLQV